jgi:hypothetical protein
MAARPKFKKIRFQMIGNIIPQAVRTASGPCAHFSDAR